MDRLEQPQESPRNARGIGHHQPLKWDAESADEIGGYVFSCGFDLYRNTGSIDSAQASPVAGLSPVELGGSKWSYLYLVFLHALAVLRFSHQRPY